MEKQLKSSYNRDMINTIADLLRELSEKENQRLKEQDIEHRPSIGTMYEGLTADILQRSLFEGLGLVVAKSSFIKGCPTEFDVILAEGEGYKYPYTDKQQFEPEQVLAVIQVKKTLNAKDLKDSYENLKHIAGLYVGKEAKEYMCNVATDSVHHTLQRSIKDYEDGKLPLEEEYVYHSLVTEAQLPVTIVIGYNGLKSEASLREKYYEYLEGMVSTEDDVKRGYGPNNFPSLFICEDNSIVKMMGMPYSAPLRQTPDGWWDFIASSHYNPMYFFLDMLWSKLHYRYGLPVSIFGDDLETPKLKPFLACKIAKQGDRMGWCYFYYPMSKQELNSITGTVEWQPTFLDEIQYRVMNMLCYDGELDFSEVPQIEIDAKEFGYPSLEELIQSLCNTGIVARTDTNKIRLLTQDCQVMMINDKFVMGESAERLNNWLIKHSAEILPWKETKKDENL